MRPYYFNPSKYKTYLEQLGIPYPPPAGGNAPDKDGIM
jgi:hypothetical protein